MTVKVVCVSAARHHDSSKHLRGGAARLVACIVALCIVLSYCYPPTSASGGTMQYFVTKSGSELNMGVLPVGRIVGVGFPEALVLAAHMNLGAVAYEVRPHGTSYLATMPFGTFTSWPALVSRYALVPIIDSLTLEGFLREVRRKGDGIRLRHIVTPQGCVLAEWLPYRYPRQIRDAFSA